MESRKSQIPESGMELAATPGLEVLDHHPYLQNPYSSTDRINVAPWGSVAKGQNPYQPTPEQARRKRVSVIAIWVAVTAVIVGGAVGGGLGGSLANVASLLSSCQKELSACQAGQDPTKVLDGTSVTTSIPFATTTGGLLIDYEVEPPSKVSNINVDCNTLNNSIQTTPEKDKFQVYCGVDFGSGKRVDGTGKDIILADLIAIRAYSMADCLQACSQYNVEAKRRKSNSKCGAVTLAVDMSNKTGGNCWLKNSTLTHSPGDGSSKDCISATEIS